MAGACGTENQMDACRSSGASESVFRKGYNTATMGCGGQGSAAPVPFRRPKPSLLGGKPLWDGDSDSNGFPFPH